MTQWKKRYISTKFRDDKFVVELDPIEKLLFMYFLTNPLTNVAGIYEISLRRIAFDTWIDKDMVQKIINRLTESKKVYYIDWYIILANSNKHQNMENAKIKKGIENVLAWLPKDLIDKIWHIYDSSMTYVWLSNNLDLDSDSNLDLDLELEDSPPSKFIKPKLEEVKESIEDFESTLLEFQKMRKTIKKPMTENAVKLLKKELDKLAPWDEEMQIAIMNKSIMNCWLWVFALKEDEKNDLIDTIIKEYDKQTQICADKWRSDDRENNILMEKRKQLESKYWNEKAMEIRKEIRAKYK